VNRTNNPQYNIPFSEQFSTVSCSSSSPQTLRTVREYYFIEPSSCNIPSVPV